MSMSDMLQLVVSSGLVGRAYRYLNTLERQGTSPYQTQTYQVQSVWFIWRNSSQSL